MLPVPRADHALKEGDVCWRWRCSRSKDVSAELKEECCREEISGGNQCCSREERGHSRIGGGATVKGDLERRTVEVDDCGYPCLVDDGGLSSRFRDGCPRTER